MLKTCKAMVYMIKVIFKHHKSNSRCTTIAAVALAILAIVGMTTCPLVMFSKLWRLSNLPTKLSLMLETTLSTYEILSIKLRKMISPFSSQCSFLIPLKRSGNQRFSDVFRGIKRNHWEKKELKRAPYFPWN